MLMGGCLTFDFSSSLRLSCWSHSKNRKVGWLGWTLDLGIFCFPHERTFVYTSHWTKLSTASPGRLCMGRPSLSYPSDSFIFSQHATSRAAESLGKPASGNICVLTSGGRSRLRSWAVLGGRGLLFAPCKGHVTRNHPSVERLLFSQS